MLITIVTTNFNSIKVQLKLLQDENVTELNTNFNSIKVQLKHL